MVEAVHTECTKDVVMDNCFIFRVQNNRKNQSPKESTEPCSLFLTGDGVWFEKYAFGCLETFRVFTGKCFC